MFDNRFLFYLFYLFLTKKRKHVYNFVFVFYLKKQIKIHLGDFLKFIFFYRNKMKIFFYKNKMKIFLQHFSI